MLHACVLVESRSETRSTRRKTRGPHAQKHDTSGNPTRERKQRLACWNLIFCPLARSGTLADVSPRGSVVSRALLPTSWLCYSRGNMRACLLLILWVPSLQEGCNAWLHSISAYAQSTVQPIQVYMMRAGTFFHQGPFKSAKFAPHKTPAGVTSTVSASNNLQSLCRLLAWLVTPVLAHCECTLATWLPYGVRAPFDMVFSSFKE